MTQDRTSKLSFSIEESVWLNKGQQVDEIVSLSLDPEITVEENGDNVLIRGGLKLTGEYRTNGKQAVMDEENYSLANQVSFRSIQEVTVNEDGTGEIKHTFPIDVTIPQERISSLDEIYVIVESFDYDLPERACIQLTADVAITGMSSEMKVGKNASQQRENDYTSVDEYVEEATEDSETEILSVSNHEEVKSAYEDRSFHFESYQEENQEALQPELAEQRQFNRDSNEQPELEVVDEVLVDHELEQVGENEAEETTEEAEFKNRDEEVEAAAETVEEATEPVEDKTPTVAFGVIKDNPKQQAEVEQDDAQPAEKQEYSFSKLKSLAGERKANQRKNQLEEAEVVVEEVHLDEVLQEQQSNKAEASSDETTEAKPPRQENALYLTKMLTKGEEEEFKKLKMCIIQQDETLNTIAARYEVNESTLIRVNKLDDSNVEEGQIIYIPV